MLYRVIQTKLLQEPVLAQCEILPIKVPLGKHLSIKAKNLAPMLVSTYTYTEYAEYAEYTEYTEFAEYADYAKYAEYIEYAEYGEDPPIWI